MRIRHIIGDLTWETVRYSNKTIVLSKSMNRVCPIKITGGLKVPELRLSKLNRLLLSANVGGLFFSSAGASRGEGWI